MDAYKNIQEKLDSIPPQFIRVSENGYDRIPLYWGREEDLLCKNSWERREKVVGDDFDSSALSAHKKKFYLLLDSIQPGYEVKKVSVKQKLKLLRAEEEEKAAARRVEANATAEREMLNNADALARGEGLMFLGFYWSNEEYAEFLEERRVKNEAFETARLAKIARQTRVLAEFPTYTEENLELRQAELIEKEAARDSQELAQTEREHSCDMYEQWLPKYTETPPSDATDEERLSFWEKQRNVELSRYSIYAEKHFGNITEFLREQSDENDIPLDSFADEFESRYKHLQAVSRLSSGLCTSKDYQALSRVDRIKAKASLEQRVNSELTEGKIKGVVWSKAKNRWRVFIGGVHYGYFLTQTEAKNVANEVRKTG